MAINLPTKIVSEGFCNCVGFLAEIYCNVVFKPSNANILHECLKVIDLHYAVAAKGVEFVLGESTVRSSVIMHLFHSRVTVKSCQTVYSLAFPTPSTAMRRHW